MVCLLFITLYKIKKVMPMSLGSFWNKMKSCMSKALKYGLQEDPTSPS